MVWNCNLLYIIMFQKHEFGLKKYVKVVATTLMSLITSFTQPKHLKAKKLIVKNTGPLTLST